MAIRHRTADGASATPDEPWWKTSAVYQVYIRSFADSDGDGLGDIGGQRGRIPYLAELGVDALWMGSIPHQPIST